MKSHLYRYGSSRKCSALALALAPALSCALALAALPAFAQATGAATAAAATAATTAPTTATAPSPPTLRALPSLDVKAYMGTWHEVARYPNRFQKQCLRDTSATYRLLDGGTVEVINRCTGAQGPESVTGLARPRGAVIEAGQLKPASLSVSFLPSWLRWLPVGWGNYDLIDLAADGSIAIVSEPTREYLWVLSRSPQISEARWQQVQSWLAQNGFDVPRVQRSAP